jgi:hypothetical protein
MVLENSLSHARYSVPEVGPISFGSVPGARYHVFVTGSAACSLTMS